MRKKILVGIVAVGIAAMLVALPYETNAQAGIIIASLIIGAGWGAVIGSWLTKQAQENNVHYVMDENATAYIETWKSYFSHWDNVVNMFYNDSLNMVNLYNGTKSYWVRMAELDALSVLNYTDWESAKENMSIWQEFGERTADVANSMLNNVYGLYADVFHELNGMANLSFGDDETSKFAVAEFQDAGSNTWAKVGTLYSMRWQHVKAKICVTIDNETSYIRTQSLWNDYNYSDGIPEIINISWEDWENLGSKVGFSCVVWTSNETDAFRSEFGIIGMQFMGRFVKGGTTTFGSLKIRYHNLTTEKYYVYSNEKDINNVLQLLKKSYNDIKTEMELQAQAYWNMLHSYGYYNASDVPPDKVLPPPPDIYFPNITLLYNATGNISEILAFYYSILHQLFELLNRSIANNETTPIYYNITYVNDFHGKHIRVSLYASDENGTNINTYIDDDWTIITGTQKDLTLCANKTYAITAQDKPSWADGVIDQTIYIYDEENGIFYNAVAGNSYYKLVVHEIKVNNESVSCVTMPLTSIDNFTRTHWNFTFRPYIYNPDVPIIVPIPHDNDWLQWIYEHKGLVVIASIVLGIFMMAGSRRGSGGYTIGMLLFIAGVIMAFYWYILPAWHNLQNLNPLHWFK